MKKNYLVTGACGFIGSHVVDQILLRDDVNKVFVVDFLGHGSNIDNLAVDERVELLVHDLANAHWREYLPHIDYILHLAAESHVDRSITDPVDFVKSNVIGTTQVLELAKEDQCRMVHVSTDEVYGHLGFDDDPFTEDSPLAPRSPYSSSKAGSDLIALSYATTFGVDVSVTRCCNNYGPRQDDEKLIPTVIKKLMNNQKIPVYGDGKNVREWIHVEDHAKAILEVLFKGEKGEVYNIAGSVELPNLSLIKDLISAVYGPEAKLEDSIEFVADRAGHDLRYALSSKHDLDSVKYQRSFTLSDTVKYFMNKNS